MDQVVLLLALMVLTGRVVKHLHFLQVDMAWRGTVHYGLL